MIPYPFTAIVGQDRLRQALLLNAVNPAIGGLLVKGPSGTAKSTAVRGLAALLPEDKDGPKRLVTELGPGLREIADNAAEAPLRANASLLLGTLHERAGDRRTAISFYRQTLALLPNEIEPRRVLALALAPPLGGTHTPSWVAAASA